MAGSMKDALRESGLAAEATAPKPKPAAPRAADDELPDDESLPPRFDAPALTTAQRADSWPKHRKP